MQNSPLDPVVLKGREEDYKKAVRNFLAVDEKAYFELDPADKETLKALSDKLYKEVEEARDKLPLEKQEELPKRKLKARLKRCSPLRVIGSSLLITMSIIGVRFLGGLQPFELGFYNFLIQFRPASQSQNNNKVLVVEVTDRDIADQQQKTDQQQKEEQVIGSLSNATLLKILKQIDNLKPVAVGLDIYRDNIPLDLKDINERNKLFAICKSSNAENGGTNESIEVAPPPYDVLQPYDKRQRVGFSDFVLDTDGVLRRYILAYNAGEINTGTSNNAPQCTTDFSFGFLLAKQYLETRSNIELEDPLVSDEYCLGVANNGSIIFPNFQVSTGGYQRLNEENTRCTILLNYQRKELEKYNDSPNLKSVQTITVKEFLALPSDQFSFFQDRIVLIGTTAYNTTRDYWYTPYTSSLGDTTSGVEIQAQAIIQILNAALPNSGGRPSIWVLPQWYGVQWFEDLVILGGALMGGFLVWYLVLPKKSGVAILITSVSALIICFFAFQLSGGWFPLIPFILALLFTGGYIHLFIWRSAPRYLPTNK